MRKKVLIAGFSGAGKTTLMSHLKDSSPADWGTFQDLDQIILKNHGKGVGSLDKLIDKFGWEAFRLWERQALEGWLKEEENSVLSLGGGALSPMIWQLYGQNRKLKFCFLKVPFDVAWSRLMGPLAETRPLVLQGQTKMKALFAERESIFRQISWVLDGTKDPNELAQQFWRELE